MRQQLKPMGATCTQVIGTLDRTESNRRQIKWLAGRRKERKERERKKEKGQITTVKVKSRAATGKRRELRHLQVKSGGRGEKGCLWQRRTGLKVAYLEIR